MKIKYWLVSSYLLVMLFPILFLLTLVHFIQSYDQKQEMLDYLDIQAKLDLYEHLLKNPSLYTGGENKNEHERFLDYAEGNVHFTLYNRDGVLLFSTNPKATPLDRPPLESIFQDLYELQANYHTFDYKRPVWEDGTIIGFYEISFLRLDWLDGVEKRKNWSIALYIVAFIMVYILVLFLLKRKLFQPLRELMNGMSLFAKGHKTRPLPRKKDEIGDLISHFEWMQHELEEKEKALLLSHQQKQYMIASISHDLKTPLTAIRVSAENLFTDETFPEDLRHRLDTIMGKADYIHHLIDDLTVYTILQSVQYKMEIIQVDGQEFFEMALSDYDELAKAHEVALFSEIKVHGEYCVNTKQMLRLFDNLLVNALHHTEKNKNIWASVISTAFDLPFYLFTDARLLMEKMNEELRGVWIIVQNEGVPIPSAQYDKLFEPLFQGDPSRTKISSKGSRGSGLGLSIAKMIIEKHGGHIYVTSTVGRGSTFFCYLPERQPKAVVHS